MATVERPPKGAAASLGINTRRRLKKVFTADDLLQLSGAASDGRRYELVDGKLYEMPLPSPRHGKIAGNISFVLQTYVRRHGLGRVMVGGAGFLLSSDPDTVRGPDVAFISYQRFPADQELPFHYADLVPDLAVEVVSPSDTRPYLQQKTEAWLAAGVQAVWVVDPRTRQAAIHRADQDALVLHSDATLEGSPALPGFTCQVADFFA